MNLRKQKTAQRVRLLGESSFFIWRIDMENENNVGNATLKLLQVMRSEMSGMRSDMQNEFRDVKGRLSHLESSITASRRDGVLVSEDFARQQVSIDSIVERIQRIEKRIELVD